MATPVAYWRTYLGGAIAGNQLLTADVEGNGKSDLLLATNGKVVAKRTDDSVVWQSGQLGIEGFDGLGDLNGDGVADVVAHSQGHVVILAATTGAVEWTEPDGEMGTIGGVRVGDVTGDGKPDVVVVECGCCGVNSGKSGFVWSFGSGFTNANQTGSLPVFACGGYLSLTLVQADTSPQYEILMADLSHFALTDATGAVLAATGSLGSETAENHCTTANLDGVPGDEMVCLLNSGDGPATNQRKLTVLHYDYSAQSALNVLWSQVVAPDLGGDMRWVDPVVDLDGDGTYELVVSTLNPNTGWQTRVFNALSGQEYTPAIGGAQVIAGTAAMEQANQRLLLTTGAGMLTAWAFSKLPQPGVTQRWQVPSAQPLTYPRPDLFARSTVNLALLATDLQGTGLDDVVTNSESALSTMTAYSGAGGTVKPVATLTLPAATNPLYTWIVPPVSTMKPQVALARTDGVLNLLDGALQPTHVANNEIDIRVGGYYASGAWKELSHAPRVFSLGGGKAESIFVDDSRQALERFDAATSSWVSPPTASWTLTYTFAPTIALNLDGANPGAACLALQVPITNPPNYRVRLVRANGTVKWDVPLETGPLADLAPGNFNGDGTPDVAVQWGAPASSNISTKAINGQDGSTIWENAPMNPGPGGFQSAGLSVAAYNGSALDDIYFQGSPTFVLSGANGGLVTQGGPGNAYSLPMLSDTNGDGKNEVVITSGLWPVTLYSSDLTTPLWTSTDDDHPYPYGSIAQCGNPSTPILVEGSWVNPARMKLTTLNGPSLGTFQTIVLAGGQLYPSEAAAKMAGAFLGQLTAANTHSNLTGKNRPTTLVGSADGWLYGVNPCSATLDFAVQLPAAVGEPVFGDTDGDGNDEILVTSADGYLYDLKNFSIASPGYVWDIDPNHGITNHDVDTIVTVDTLWGTWGSVPGATSYSVAVATPNGLIISNPAWQSVGTMTQAAVTGLPLQAGSKYFFAVRAISATGPSVDAVSNGVVVTAGPPTDAGAADATVGDAGLNNDGSAGLDGSLNPDGSLGEQPGGGGGCGCRVATEARPAELELSALAVAFLTVVTRRRRERR